MSRNRGRGMRAKRSRNTRAHRFGVRAWSWALIFLVGSSAGLASSAVAQTTDSPHQAAQYVFLIDDSGSMRTETAGPGRGAARLPAADPNRLAVFAARAVLSLLDDADEATVVRLNGLEGEAPPIRPLGEARAALETLLDSRADVEDEIADYSGQHTPCNRALAGVRDLLNRARRDGGRQVLIYLTDGQCEVDNRAERIDIDSFLSSVDSYRGGDGGQLLFYLLRFRGRPFSGELVSLAERTHGAAFELDSTDVTGILAPFARAIARAQGFDVIEVSPRDPTIAAHGAARRMRVLAVAQGSDGAAEPALSVALRPQQGGAPSGVRETSGVFHHVDSARRLPTYRFASVEYRPTASPMSVSVGGADSDWRLIAIPEYRFQLQMDMLEGTCNSGRAESITSARIGGSACFRIRLQSVVGEGASAAAVPIERAGFTGNVEFGVAYGPAGPAQDTEFAAERGAGANLDATFERQGLREGDYDVRPYARLWFGGGGCREATAGEGSSSGPPPNCMRIWGTPRTLAVNNTTLNVEPRRWSVGPIAPGDHPRQEIQIGGNFEAQAFDIVPMEPAPPPCVHFRMDTFDSDAGFELRAGQTYTLGVVVDGFCGWESGERRISGSVRVVSRTDPGLAAVIEYDATLNVEITLPEEIVLEVGREETARAAIEIGGNASGPLRLLATLSPAPAGAWPAEDLAVGFLDAATSDGLRRSGASLAVTDVEVSTERVGGAPATATLAALAVPCCADGEYRGLLQLRSGADDPSPPPPIPVVLRVTGYGLWACWGNAILAVFAVLATLAMIRFFLRMRDNSYFVSTERLERFLPDCHYNQGVFDAPPLDAPATSERALHWIRNFGWMAGFGVDYSYYEVWTMRSEHAVEADRHVTEWVASLEAPSTNEKPTDGVGGPRMVVVGRGLEERPAYYLFIDPRQDEQEVQLSVNPSVARFRAIVPTRSMKRSAARGAEAVSESLVATQFFGYCHLLHVRRAYGRKELKAIHIKRATP